MKNGDLIAQLQKWPMDAEVTVMIGDKEELPIVEVNEPAPRVYGPVIWVDNWDSPTYFG